MKKNLLIILLLLISPIVLAVNNTASDIENVIGGELGKIIGTGSYNIGGTSLEMGSIAILLFVLIFMFIWSSSSGIGWDGVFFLMVLTMGMLSSPETIGVGGAWGWAFINIIFAVVMIAVLYYTILRRG